MQAGGGHEDEEGREAAIRKLVKSAAGLEKMVEDGQQLVCKCVLKLPDVLPWIELRD